MDINSLLQRATVHFQRGQLTEAEALAQGIVNTCPDHADACHLLGLIAGQRGRHDLADQFIARAIRNNPNNPSYHLNHGLALIKLNRLVEALVAYEQAIQLNPNIPEAHNKRGNLLRQLGRPEDALSSYKHAIQLQPAYAEAHYNLGNVYQAQGHPEQAVVSYQQAIAINPVFAEAWCNLGNSFLELDQLDEALAAYERAIELRTDYAEVHSNRGMVLVRLDRRAEALAAYDQAIQLMPDLAVAHNNRGLVLLDLDRAQEALKACENAIQIMPDYAEAYNNRGLALNALGRLEEAVVSCRQATELKPEFYEAYCNLGNILLGAGCLGEAEVSYRRALELKPDYARAHSNLLCSLNYSPVLSQEALYQAHCDWDRRHARELLPAPVRAGDGSRGSGRRLRVGYVSPDFRSHSVAYFFEPLLEAHHREAVEVFCYANVQLADATTERLQAKAEHWLSITAMPDAEVVQRIRQDGIDILVDLAGHTAHNRLLVFACKPAPIQVAWLGYPNTTGMRAMDYRLTDAVADPVGESDRLHTETLVRLESGFLCYRPFESAPPVSRLPALDAGHITFGSFNKLTKVSVGVIAVWAEILRLVPGSRLLLKDKALVDAATRERYLGLFAEHGISASRIELFGPLPRTEDHLRLYGRVDISLDTFPYNGTTTTCEALWMGVPVVTLAGELHAGRVGASLLEQVGRPEWVTETPGSFINAAVQMGRDISVLAVIRGDLRSQVRNSPLCNADAFAHSIESAYRGIWKKPVTD